MFIHNIYICNDIIKEKEVKNQKFEMALGRMECVEGGGGVGK